MRTNNYLSLNYFKVKISLSETFDVQKVIQSRLKANKKKQLWVIRVTVLPIVLAALVSREIGKYSR